MASFVAHVEEIKKQARQDMESGALTPGYQANVEEVLKMLNSALASELVCVLRYRNHYRTAKGMDAEPIAAQFLEHSNNEQMHADMLAERIGQLNGNPNYDPNGLNERADTDYVECDTIEEMVRENLVAERIVIGLYREMIEYLSTQDPTSRRLLESILKDEEEHADELSKLLH